MRPLQVYISFLPPPPFSRTVISFDRIFFPELTNQCWKKGTTVKHVIRWRCQNPSACNPSPCNLSACNLSACNPWHRRSKRETLSLSSLLSLSLRLSSNFNGVKRAIGGEIAGFRLTNRIYNLQQESRCRFDGLLLLEEDLLRRDVLQARRQLLRHRTGASSGRKTDAYLPNLSHLSSHPTNTDASALSARRLSLSLRWSGS